MKKKILKGILAFFGLLGFAMVFGGAIWAYINYETGVTVAVIGLVIMILATLGNYLLIRLSNRRPRLLFDRRWRKVLGLKF